MKRTLLAVGLAVLVSMMVVPWGIGGHEPVRDYGPFFLSHFIYDAVGAYTKIASDLLEDVAMARLVKSSGRKIFFRYGGDAVRTRMYRSFA